MGVLPPFFIVSNMQAPFTIFNETRMVPVVVYKDGQKTEDTTWEKELWVERGEDYYAMMNDEYKNKKVRIIDRELFLRSPKI